MNARVALKNESKADMIVSAIQGQVDSNVLHSGDRLMTVRKLSSLYKINERTVLAALKVLFNHGVIEKKGKSYFISLTGRDQESQIKGVGNNDGAPHPFIAMNGNRIGSRLVKMAVYENMPHQKDCWSAIAAKFGEAYPGMTLEIKWIPNSINTSETYLVFLKEERVDLALLPDAIGLEFVRKKVLAPLPGHLQKRISSPEYLASHIKKAFPEISRYAAPVHFSMQAVLVNNSVVDGRISWKHRDMAGLTRRIMSAAETLHHGALFCNLPWELAILNGLPESPARKEDLKLFFEDLYVNLNRLSSFKDLCVWKMYPTEDLYRDYAAGNIMLYAGNLTMILHLLKNADFDWSGIFFQVGNGRSLPGGTSSVAIMQDASSQAEAAVDFLTSVDAQALFSEHRLNMSCYLETNRPVLEAMRADESQFLANVRKICTNETDCGKWHSIKVLDMKNITQRVINGESSARQAVGDAMAYVKQVYPGKIKRRDVS